ncbi:MAG: P-loop NTPase, partial [bacterium]
MKSIWAIGGGKGGTGKSFMTASLGIQLAQFGRRTIIVDADLGAANLHTCLGVKSPKVTLADFLSRTV